MITNLCDMSIAHVSSSPTSKNSLPQNDPKLKDSMLNQSVGKGASPTESGG